MSSQEAANCKQLRKSFENQEAIYVEKGALRVRVRNIRMNPCARYVEAEVEEILTPGLGVGLFGVGLFVRPPSTKQARPLRWVIGAGYLTTFSDHGWQMGYGGWSLHFATRAVQAVVDLAAGWPAHLDWYDRYKEVLRCLQYHDAYEQSRRVFPE